MADLATCWKVVWEESTAMKAHGGAGFWREPATHQVEEALLQAGVGVERNLLLG